MDVATPFPRYFHVVFDVVSCLVNLSIACGRKREYPGEIYDRRLTDPDWRESLRSCGLRRFYNPNHPVNIAYGRKPEYPEGIYDYQQSDHELLT